MAKRTESEPRPSARQRIAELQNERREVTEQIIMLEQRGVRPGSVAAAAQHERALALISGDPEPMAPAADAEAELSHLHERRAVIDEALRMLRQAEVAEEGARLRAEFQAERAEWMAAVRKRVLCAIALVRANQEFEAYRRRYSALGMLPTSGLKLLGWGEIPGNEVHRAAEECVRLGICTKKEVEL